MADKPISQIITPPLISRKEAMAHEPPLTRYFTGKPCKYGHVAERQTNNGTCVVCKIATDRVCYVAMRADPERREPDKLRRSTYDRAWSKTDKGREKSRRNRKTEVARKTRRRYRKRPDVRKKENAIIREYRKTPKGRAKKNLMQRRRRVRKRGAIGSHTPAEVAEIRRLQMNRCAEPTCRIKFSKKVPATEDHIKALKLGGTDYANNIQLLCRPCNSKKSALDTIEYARRKGRLL